MTVTTNARVLIAEPSRTLASLIRVTLGPLMLDAHFVTDGREALAAARDMAPQLVIADAGLPGLDGYSLAEAIRNHLAGDNVRFLLTVTDHAPADRERIAYLGIDDVLTKPFERAALLERVRALIVAQPEAAPPQQTSYAPSYPASPPPPTGPMPRPIQRSRRPTPSHTLAMRDPSDGIEGATLTSLVRQRIDATLGELLNAKLEAALPGLVTDAVNETVERELPGLAAASLKDELNDAVHAQLNVAIERLAAPLLEDAIQAALAARMDELLEHAALDIKPHVEAALRDSLPKKMKGFAEKVVWKVVPELAEDIIKDEITRLTSEDEA